MLKRIKQHLLLIVMSLTLTAPVIIPALPASAAVGCNNVGNAISSGINFTQGSGAGQQCGNGGSITTGIGTLAGKIVNLFSIIVGIVAVIMIIYSGFRYVTSGGESSSVSGAKNTLVYAIVGIIIVVIAQLVVRYVLNSAASVNSSAS